MCNKALGKASSGYNSRDDDNGIGLTKDFNAPFYADVIGTSYCRSHVQSLVLKTSTISF